MNALPLGDSKTTTYNMDVTPSSINRFSYRYFQKFTPLKFLYKYSFKILKSNDGYYNNKI